MDASILRAVAENASRERAVIAETVAAGRDDERGRADAILATVLPLVGNARVFAASLEHGGKPPLPSRPYVGARGAVALRLGPTAATVRALLRGADVRAIFDASIRTKSDVEARRGAAERASSPASIVAANGFGAAVESLFTTIARGEVGTFELPATSKPIAEVLARVFAPVVDAGLVRFTTSDAPAPAVVAASPIFVVPYLYATDELAYQSKDIAATVALGAIAGEPPTELVVANGWPQRDRFVEAVGAPSLSVVEVGADDPIEFLRAAVQHSNAGERARSSRLVVHPAYDDDRSIGAALEDAIAGLRSERVAVNAWPALLHLAPLAASFGLEGVDKLVLRAPLRRSPRPAHFRDHPRPRLAAERLVDFTMRPSLVAALRS